jgi:predicted metalloprotease
MSFNDDAGLDTSQVEGGGGGSGRGGGFGGGFGGGGLSGGGGFGGGGIAVGGGLGTIVLLVVIALLTHFGGGGSSGTSGSTAGAQSPYDTTQVGGGGANSGNTFSQCRTGADANRDAQCRVIGTVNSVQDFWASELPKYGQEYTPSKTVLYSGQTQSACGTASNQVGPFYCPNDKRVYIDASFFDELTSRFGADGGPLAQEYVVAHEYGHHIQDILGLLGRAQQDPQGAKSGSVRAELMADCLAGDWVKHASQTKDASGRTLLKPITQSDIKAALSAASAVGDDRIQQKTQGRVTPETWTHGSSAERERWFTTGYTTGDLSQCNTFDAATL